MKNVLIFSGYNDFNALEIAKEMVEQGNQVYYLECDKTLGICQHNGKGCCMLCRHCSRSMHKAFKNLGLHKQVKMMWLKNVFNDTDMEEACEFRKEFNSVQELKNLTYHGAQVGYGAFSSYVTLTRNVMPDMTDNFKHYINYYIDREVMMYHALERIHNKYHFDQIVFHNGRFAQFKPFLEFARLNNIVYLTTEAKTYNSRLLKDYFVNDIPHSLDYICNNVLKNWEEGNPENREAIGRSFYEKRKKGIKAGDTVYIKDQHSGEMPEGWNNNVENITIFNSSEDEFCSVSKDYDNNLLFSNQYMALKTIFDHYRDDNTKHFYVRIHPNMKNVPFKSHQLLYHLKYDNVTIIPANSTVSSYTLMDNSDKIIIFNSTIGMEAAYWGKPVISLTKYFYWKLGVLYHPNTPEEIWPLLDNQELEAKDKDNVNLIKYGYWLLHPNYPEVKNVPYHFVEFSIGGHHYTDYTFMKFMGSYKGHVLFERIMNKITIFSKFKKLPCTEPYIG